ncbi:hypothetical protein C1T17_02730 [Sphingobium sp. SCG-1]|uniref:hypothetical protein n=1 Tax=Sphingobium sp. SCG-1 TaxID=2072936 RepID=UPI000CD6C02A|nr:hypothetical protein [Sphingobium sp. SCG-1]AUW57161.1 hypothetical protein C1T17_02730 [Sphingobium sp. SCG-1]
MGSTSVIADATSARSGVEGSEWFRTAPADQPLRRMVEVEGALIEVLEWGNRNAPGIQLLDVGLGPNVRTPPVDPRRRVFSTREEGVERYRLTPAQDAEPYISRHIAAASLTEAGEGWEWCFDLNIAAKLERPHHWDLVPQAKWAIAFVRGQNSRVVREELQEQQRAWASSGTPFATVPLAVDHLMLDQPIALAATLRAFAAIWEGGGETM